MAMSSIRRVAVRRVRNPAGAATEWQALHLRLRPGTSVPVPTQKGWLPVVWLTTKSTTGKEPQLEAALRLFPDDLLPPSLAKEKRITTREFSASGVLEEQPIPWTGAVLPSAGVTAALLAFGQSLLGTACLSSAWECWASACTGSTCASLSSRCPKGRGRCG